MRETISTRTQICRMAMIAIGVALLFCVFGVFAVAVYAEEEGAALDADNVVISGTEKIVNNESLTNVNLTFVLTAKDKANPMPEGAANGVKEVTIPANGEFSFGKMAFPENGLFKYTVSRKLLQSENLIQDDARYNVEITVFRDGTAVMIYRKAGESFKADRIEYKDTYEESVRKKADQTIKPLMLRSNKQKKKSVKLTWNRVTGATKYIVYGNRCNKGDKKYKVKKIAEISGKTFNVKKIGGKKLKKGTYYKFIVIAYDDKNNMVSYSRMIHVTTKGGKYRNHKRVKVKNAKKFRKMTVGKTKKIKAKAIGKKVQKHIGLRYESTNPKVATVTKSGKVKAISKGKATIIVYAQNGKFKNVKVVVK